MVSVGCIVCKSCHIPNCPTGITGTPGDLQGPPGAHQGVPATPSPRRCGSCSRRWASRTSARDRRPQRPARANGPEGQAAAAALVDVSKFIHPDMALSRLGDDRSRRCRRARGVCGRRRRRRSTSGSSTAARDAIETAPERRPRCSASGTATARSGRRSAGHDRRAATAGRGCRTSSKIKVRFEGEAGQSFGAWCVNGLDLELRGFAQDGVAKGISGGTVVVTLDYAASRLRRRDPERGRQQRRLRGDRRARSSSAAGPATASASATPARRSWPRRPASTPAST